jgi:ABC-type transport system substrate-binding protein
MDIPRQILIVRGGQALAAQSPIAAHLSGYDAAFRSEMGEYSPARAKALLDMYGYIDRDGDGWRDQPDGRPLMLEMASQTDADSRQSAELIKRDMDAIGVRVVFKLTQWPENLRASRAGKLMMWSQGYGAIAPDGQVALERFYSPAAGESNMSRFKLAEMDALYEQLLALPDGPERDALFDRAKRLAVAYMPEKTTVHRMFTFLAQPWLEGYRPRVFGVDWYHRVDIDTARMPAR